MQINLYYANRAQFPASSIYFVGGGNLRVNREEATILAKPASMLISVILAFFAGNWGAMQWEELLLFTNRLTVGTVDPVIGKDLGFYLFSLPFMEMLKAFAGFMLLATTLIIAAVYYVRGGITLTERGAAIDEKVRRHLAVLIGIFACVIAAGFYLDSFGLLFSNNGSFYGAGYVDVNSRLLTYRVLTFLTPLAGAMLAVGLWKGTWRLALLPPVSRDCTLCNRHQGLSGAAAEIQGCAQ